MARDSDTKESPAEKHQRLLRQVHERLESEDKDSRREQFYGDKQITLRYKAGDLIEIELADRQTLR